MDTSAKIVFVGSGSLRCCAPVFAGIFNCWWQPDSMLYLVDTNEERLDLSERLARCFAAESRSNLRVTTDSMEASLKDATHVVLAFGLGHYGEEDEEIDLLQAWCVLNGIQLPEREHAETSKEERLDFMRAILLNPIFEEVNQLLPNLARNALVVNLVRPVELTAPLLAVEAIHLDWPEALSQEERLPLAHQILRWIRSEEYLGGELLKNTQNPIVNALKYGEPKPENRFNPKALAGYLARLT
ncbi:MAG TPA: hypothetical protein VNK96_00835 [Fimbriimonadales bacterium]|nr:hypothetical protein [Fimbriimonadales bacterium]